jgi:hypothetical protein
MEFAPRSGALDPLEPYSAVERVTGIEPALSAWESDFEPISN